MRTLRPTPVALAPVRVIVSRSIHAYAATSAPLASAIRLRLWLIRTAFAVHITTPRQPTSGSELSWLICADMSPSVTPGNPMAAHTQFLHHRRGLHPLPTDSALPNTLPSDSRRGNAFRSLTTVRLRYNLPTCSPPLSELTESLQPTETFTTGLPVGRSLFPLPVIATMAAGQAPSAGLPPARSNTSFAARATAYSRHGGYQRATGSGG